MGFGSGGQSTGLGTGKKRHVRFFSEESRMMKILAIAANFAVLALIAGVVYAGGIPGDEQIRLFALIGAATLLSLIVLVRYRAPDAQYQKFLDDEADRLRRELATSE